MRPLSIKSFTHQKELHAPAREPRRHLTEADYDGHDDLRQVGAMPLSSQLRGVVFGLAPIVVAHYQANLTTA